VSKQGAELWIGNFPRVVEGTYVSDRTSNSVLEPHSQDAMNHAMISDSK
jgi:hypothetical protein